MPINIELPLECNRPTYTNLRDARIVGPNIEVTYGTYGDVAAFNAETGIYVGHETENDNPVRIREKSAEVAVKQFKIFFGHKDWGKKDWRFLMDESLYLFTDPKLAKAKADELNAESASAGAPWKFMVKSNTIMSANHAWRSWMEARFESGEYQPVPWSNEPWYNKDHFCHTSLADPFKVAFCESVVAGVEDKMVVTNPGRYLERFYSETLSAKEIAVWAAKADSEAELCFATTEADIEYVYTESGISSCMNYKADNPCFPLGIHPTRAYASGDLQLAYLKRRNKIVARALVWPDKLVVGRIYGDEERLKTRLQAEGYTYKASDPTVFHGAKLLRIEVEGVVVLPYLDWNMGADDHPTDPGFLVMVDKNQKPRPKYAGQTQNGTATGESIRICGHNGCRTRLVGEYDGLYNSQSGRQMCFTCADAVMVRCVVNNQYYDRTSTNYVVSQILDRNDQPVAGYRGGWVSHNSVRDYPRVRLIGDKVYLATETEAVPGRARLFRPIAAATVAA